MRTRERGFTLIEVTVAVALLMTAIAGIGQLAIVSARANEATRSSATVEWLAREKLEQLTALALTADDGLLSVTDYATDVTQWPLQPSGGVGLSVSPGDTLATAASGYVDYLDSNGVSVGGGGSPPRDARWQRRWSVQAVAGQPDVLMLQVILAPARTTGAVMARDAAAMNGAWLVSLRSRRAR